MTAKYATFLELCLFFPFEVWSQQEIFVLLHTSNLRCLLSSLKTTVTLMDKL